MNLSLHSLLLQESGSAEVIITFITYAAIPSLAAYISQKRHKCNNLLHTGSCLLPQGHSLKADTIRCYRSLLALFNNTEQRKQ